jgi:hypothetical protein
MRGHGCKLNSETAEQKIRRLEGLKISCVLDLTRFDFVRGPHVSLRGCEFIACPSWRCSLVTKTLTGGRRKGAEGGAFLSLDRHPAARAPAESGRWNERAGRNRERLFDRAALAISGRPLIPPRGARREQRDTLTEGQTKLLPPPSSCVAFLVSRAAPRYPLLLGNGASSINSQAL